MRAFLTYGRSLLVTSSPIVTLALLALFGFGPVFFVIQYVFPYSHYYRVTHVPYTMVHTFGGKYAGLYSLVQWAVVVPIVAWVARRRAPRQIFLIAVTTVVALTIAAHATASALGYEFELDSL
ncbi:MAG TPA: hypothetical protein VNZ64_17160 [Candidatus Acidoferrum sp.]|jgi:hypothetical protein|nr:hypothetical protein [Candidatus Acidoferrum sp.]